MDQQSGTEQAFYYRLSVRTVALGAFVIALVVYCLTMNPTFGFIDKGELAASASTLGVAHPTGYPTFIFLGHIVTVIAGLVGMREITALNALAAVLTAASAGVLTLVFDRILRKLDAFSPGIIRKIDTIAADSGSMKKSKDSKSKKSGKEQMKVVAREKKLPPTRSGFPATLCAGIAALITVFTSTWWNQSNGFEVYALHVLMITSVTYAFLKYVDGAVEAKRAGNTVGFERSGFVFAALLGLSFTNHLTTILLAPAFLVYFFWSMGFSSITFKRLVYLVPGFLAGFVPPYAWQMIRAGMNPQFNWGSPYDLTHWWRHFSGWQFRVWMFSNKGAFAQQTKYFFSTMPSQLVWVGVVLVLAGFAWLWMRNKSLFTFAALLFVASVVYAGGYDIGDIDSYYLTAYLALGIAIAAGFGLVHQYFGPKTTAGLAAGFLLLVTFGNFNAANERDNTLVEDMTVNMLSTLPKNAVIFSSQWDFWVSGSWYMQNVEKVRPDVLVIDQELLRRSWYLDQLKRNHPEFMGTVADLVADFRKQVDKFENGIPYNDAEIQGAYVGMIRGMINSAMKDRPVFITSELNLTEPQIVAQYAQTPWYLAQRLTTDSAYIPQPFPKYKFSFWRGHIDTYTAKTYEIYIVTLSARARYEAAHGNDSLSKKYLQYAKTFDPQWTEQMIPPLPRGGADILKETIAMFEQLRSLK